MVRRQAFEAELNRITRLAGVSQIEFLPGWLRDPL